VTRAAGALLLLTAACARPGPPPLPVTIAAPGSFYADSIAHQLILTAVAADAALRKPDSVYIDNAEIIADGAPRIDPPLLAGVGGGGNIQLGSSRFAVTSNFVWGTTQYRWVPADPARRIVEGWATLVIGQNRDGAWRILHLHSSTVRDSTPP
jgi:hypothetical protein